MEETGLETIVNAIEGQFPKSKATILNYSSFLRVEVFVHFHNFKIALFILNGCDELKYTVAPVLQFGAQNTVDFYILVAGSAELVIDFLLFIPSEGPHISLIVPNIVNSGGVHSIPGKNNVVDDVQGFIEIVNLQYFRELVQEYYFGLQLIAFE